MPNVPGPRCASRALDKEESARSCDSRRSWDVAMIADAPRCICARLDRRTLLGLAVRAQRMISVRIGADLVTTPAWDMLLDLYVREDRRPMSLTSLCGASSAPPRTALRIINKMVERDLLSRAPDPEDGRRILVELSPKAVMLLDQYFDGLLDLLERSHGPDEHSNPGLLISDQDSELI